MIDVIIPTHANWRHLELCIQSVERFTKNDHRIILVDSASPEQDTKRVLAEAKKRGHVVVTLGVNESFSKAINAGLAASKAEYICILNDDVYVLDGWDATMISELADQSVGMVGARMPGAAAGFQGNPEFADTLPVPYLIFAHVMMRRKVFEAIGELDAATFDGWGSEDIDYSLRIRDAGLRLKVSAARSMHVGGVTMEQSGGAEGRYREYNRMFRKLEEKWGKERIDASKKLFPRVALAVPTYNGKVDNDFFQSAMMLQKTGPFSLEIYQTKRLVIHYARERIAEDVLKAGFDYLWWLDDDMTFPADTLERLLRHQKPVVTAVAYQRREPFNACIFDWVEHEKDKAFEYPNGMPVKTPGHFEHMNGQEHTGLRKIAGCGSACVLTDTKVFKQLKAKKPWFDNRSFGEDLHFCRLCAEEGIPVYADTDLIIGHVGDPIIVDEAFVAQYRGAKARRDSQPILVGAQV